MAHTDACKIQATQFVRKQVDAGLSLNKACQNTEKESDGIPWETIKRWWYEIQKETEDQFKNEPPEINHQTSSQIQKKPSTKREDGGRFSSGTAPGPGRSRKYNPKPKLPPKQKQEPPQKVAPYTLGAMQFACIAESQLSRIDFHYTDGLEALLRVRLWIENRIKEAAIREPGEKAIQKGRSDVSEEFEHAYRLMEDAICSAKDSQWEGTSHEAVLKKLFMLAQIAH